MTTLFEQAALAGETAAGETAAVDALSGGEYPAVPTEAPAEASGEYAGEYAGEYEQQQPTGHDAQYNDDDHNNNNNDNNDDQDEEEDEEEDEVQFIEESLPQGQGQGQADEDDDDDVVLLDGAGDEAAYDEYAAAVEGQAYGMDEQGYEQGFEQGYEQGYELPPCVMLRYGERQFPLFRAPTASQAAALSHNDHNDAGESHNHNNADESHANDHVEGVLFGDDYTMRTYQMPAEDQWGVAWELYETPLHFVVLELKALFGIADAESDVSLEFPQLSLCLHQDLEYCRAYNLQQMQTFHEFNHLRQTGADSLDSLPLLTVNLIRHPVSVRHQLLALTAMSKEGALTTNPIVVDSDEGEGEGDGETVETIETIETIDLAAYHGQDDAYAGADPLTAAEPLALDGTTEIIHAVDDNDGDDDGDDGDDDAAMDGQAFEQHEGHGEGAAEQGGEAAEAAEADDSMLVGYDEDEYVAQQHEQLEQEHEQEHIEQPEEQPEEQHKENALDSADGGMAADADAEADGLPLDGDATLELDSTATLAPSPLLATADGTHGKAPVAAADIAAAAAVSLPVLMGKMTASANDMDNGTPALPVSIMALATDGGDFYQADAVTAADANGSVAAVEYTGEYTGEYEEEEEAGVEEEEPAGDQQVDAILGDKRERDLDILEPGIDVAPKRVKV